MRVAIRERIEKTIAEETLEAELIRRAMALRKQGRFGILLAECGRYYLAESEYDLWGSRRPLSLPQLQAMVESAEIERKPPQTERAEHAQNARLATR